MKNKILSTLALPLLLGGGTVLGQSTPEIARLQKRLEELEQKTSRLEAENRKLSGRTIEAPPSTVEKIKLAGGISELKLSSELRLRYQYENADSQQYWDANKGRYTSSHGSEQSRWRFRLRVAADFKLGDDWFAGIGLQTGQNADSGFQTYSGGFENYGVYLHRAFVGWNAAEWLTVVAGKQANPFYKSELLWGNDLAPTGLSETFRLGPLLGAKTDWELTLVAGQFIFDDNIENFAGDPDRKVDAYLFEQQLIARYPFNDKVKLTVAPSFLFYNAANITLARNTKSFSAATAGAGWEDIGHTRDLHILQLPGDVAFPLFGRKARFLWDVAYNLAGDGRTRDIYGLASHEEHDNWAFLVGFELGENKKKGDWSLGVNYRQVGVAAIDPNLNDSTWAFSNLNTKGWKVAAAYNFADFIIGSVTFFTADNLRKDLYGGQATGGAKLADLNSGQAVQVDLSVKF
ncbi:MAG TPA: putative porin [Chthoniobacteraceae bacterium]|nr:putative porin [Chthoniobacteraceae bacterium]